MLGILKPAHFLLAACIGFWVEWICPQPVFADSNPIENSLWPLTKKGFVLGAESAPNFTRGYDECPYAMEVPDPPPPGKIALTFDDGPGWGTTAQALDILQSHGVSATFFLVGEMIPGKEDLLPRMLAEGHRVGNHTYSHFNAHCIDSSDPDCASSCPCDFASYQNNEILQVHNVIQPFLERGRYFRFPYGTSTCAAKDLVEGMCYRITGWQIDSCDWAFNAEMYDYCTDDTYYHSQDRYIDWVLHEAERVGGGIILMHDIHWFTVNHLDELLTRLQEAGFEFIELSDPVFGLLNKVPEQGQAVEVQFLNPPGPGILSGTIDWSVRAFDPDVGSQSGDGIDFVLFTLHQGRTLFESWVVLPPDFSLTLPTANYPDGSYQLGISAAATFGAGCGHTQASLEVSFNQSPPEPGTEAESVQHEELATEASLQDENPSDEMNPEGGDGTAEAFFDAAESLDGEGPEVQNQESDAGSAGPEESLEEEVTDASSLYGESWSTQGGGCGCGPKTQLGLDPIWWVAGLFFWCLKRVYRSSRPRLL